jgi:hypothetical protein
LLDAWARSGLRESGEKAEALLDHNMITLHKSGEINFETDDVSYNSFMSNCAKLGLQKRAGDTLKIPKEV